MRDVGPEGFIAVHELERVTKGLGLNAHPQGVDVVGGQLSLRPRGVQLAFKVVKGDLANDRIDHILYLARQQGLALGLGLGPVQKLAEGQHLAKDAGRFGKGQRGRGQQLSLTRCQHLMDAVAQLMRKGHHVARFAKIVQHHIRMHGGDGRVRKGPGGLAGLDARVDPALVEEGGGKIGHPGIEGAVGIGHRLARFGPIDNPWRLVCQGGVAVPDLKLVQPQPLGFQAVIAVRKLGVGRHNSIAQRLDHLGFDMVRQVPPCLRRRHLAPAVVNFLFLGQRVVDAGKKLDVAPEHIGKRMGRRLAPGADGIGQEVQRRFKAQLFRLARNGEHQACHRFVEQLVPRRGTHNAFVMQELFQLVRQLVWPHRAHPVKDRLVAGEGRVGVHQAGQVVVVQPVELQTEEHKRGGGRGHPVLRVAHELRALGVDGVLVIAQARKGHEPPGDDVDAFVFLHACQKARCILSAKLAFVGRRKGRAGTLKLGHVGGILRAICAWVQVGQIPVGQIAEAA